MARELTQPGANVTSVHRVDETDPADHAVERWSTARGRQRQTKREAIMAVASGCFADLGYAETTLADIADVLGVTNKALYYYFDNKEDLFLETVEASQRALRQCIEESDARGKNGFARIRLHVEGVMILAQKRGPLALDTPLSLARTRRGRAVRAEECAQQERLVAMIRDGIEDGSISRGGDPYVLWNHLLGALVWMPRWARRGSEYGGQAALNAALDLVDRLLGDS